MRRGPSINTKATSSSRSYMLRRRNDHAELSDVATHWEIKCRSLAEKIDGFEKKS
jgi:hypothetical protein